MREDQCHKPELDLEADRLHPDEKQHQRNADDDFRVDDRHIGDIHNQAALPPLHIDDADGGKGADHCRNDRGDHRDNQRVNQRIDNDFIREQPAVPV